MTNEDNTEEKREERHSNGRWKKGHCPNPLGRRKAKINNEQEMVRSIQQHTPDIFHFSRATVEMKMNGKSTYMSRHAAVLHKLYEGAMKGNITAQREFLKAVRENAEMIAMIRHTYDDMLHTWVLDNPHARDPDYELPKVIELELIELQNLLGEFYPHSYKERE